MNNAGRPGTGRRIPLFYVVTALYWLSLYTYVATLPTYAKSLGASYKLIGMIVGSYGFTQMALRIPLGIVSDRLRRRKLFACAGVAVSLCSALGLFFFPNPWAVLIFRGLSGVSAAAWVSFTVLYSSYYEEQAAPKAIAIINAVCSFGTMTGIFIGGVAAQRFGSLAPFEAAAVTAAVGFALSLFIRENRPEPKEQVRLRALFSVLKDRRFLLVSLLAILAQFITFSTVYGFTPVAAKAIGANSFDLGLLTTLSTLPGIFASLLSGTVLIRKFGEKKVIIAGFAITTAACITIPFIRSLGLLYLTQALGGFGLGGAFPLLMGLSIKNVPGDRRSTAMGLFQAIYGIGMFLGPTAVGFLSDVVGLKWGFFMIGLVGAAAICIALRYPTSVTPQKTRA